MLLFLKILYNNILYCIIYPVLTVLTFVYSQYSSNSYKLLRADTEGNGSQARKVTTVSRHGKRLTTVDLFSNGEAKSH